MAKLLIVLFIFLGLILLGTLFIRVVIMPFFKEKEKKDIVDGDKAPPIPTEAAGIPPTPSTTKSSRTTGKKGT